MTSVVEGVPASGTLDEPVVALPTERVAGTTMADVTARLGGSALMTKGPAELARFDGQPVEVVELPADPEEPIETARAEAKPLKATTPVDDRFPPSKWGTMTAAERLAEVRKNVQGGLGSTALAGPFSTWTARRIRGEAARQSNPVARNNVLRRAGLL